MSIESQQDLSNLQQVSEAVAITLKKMREHAQPGMSTKELDEYGGKILTEYGARSAPNFAYQFPGWTCISVNQEMAHGLPSEKKILKEGDLINIDVSAELNGYWSDNGGSFVLGRDIHNHNKLVDTSRQILFKAIHSIKGGVKIADIGRMIEMEARKAGYKVIRNLTGHGIGRSLHEDPDVPCFYEPENKKRFKKNSVVAVETFISTKATRVHEQEDGWTLAAKDGSLVAQHEHTIIVTDHEPIILTKMNNIWEN